ncbi:MAG: polyhydroxyalkanoic acid system family protein [Candidatus Liptonbacteria bacterium]|nr:polyhydroxyalkanoic acid system family protein [Candidatus Liptonbacteria bacterium]
MIKLSVAVPHTLPRDEALRQARLLLGEVKVRLAGEMSDLREKWDDNIGICAFSVTNFPALGKLIVKENEVEIDINLPSAAESNQEKIESALREVAEALLT